jgi:hypothetical protein
VNVSLHVWRIPATGLPGALWRVATGPRRVRRLPGVRFVKLLGTGRGREFGPARADMTRWAALTVSDGPPPGWPEWARRSTASCRIDLAVLRVRGRWAGREPFPEAPTAADGDATKGDAIDGDAIDGHDAVDGDDADGPVLALTRARLRPARAVTFWRSVAPVASALAGAPGLLAAFGIGEAPLGWQGTVSVWRSAPDLARFAYRHPQHRRAIEQTAANRWYAEELFARFAVLDVVGDTEVIGWGTARQ